ncbi:hypothetical protein psyc5s11_03230 [Clostridium gelidum]|uniref:Plantaricin C family lantibiotic n=1 Tax=Clostridium gelidum TaxID=704125 RepID=A0ABN6IPY4_9CLOT|nr:plantaricin C family lantibiotic [Clostridium gelidum]BCZ44256.1 hypothetical protein psyc5s11_03230 [Clostridium gelidum]
MNFSKRNPLLRNNMDEFNEIIGSLGDEIDEQNLENIDGGSTPACVAVASVCAVVTAAGGVYAWANEKATAKYKCGGVLTATAECFHC